MAKALGSLSVGSIVKFRVGGVYRDFILVNQGKPSNLYSDSCDGSWLLMKQSYGEERQWNDSPNNKYQNSKINEYLNSTFFNLLDTDIQSDIKQVRIPYSDPIESVNSDIVVSGESGLPCKVFLLSMCELGINKRNAIEYLPNDGAKLSYFLDGNELISAQNLRKCYTVNGVNVNWWSRSGQSRSVNWVAFVSMGGYYNGNNCIVDFSIRPTVIFPLTQMVDDNGYVLTNQPPIISDTNRNLGDKNTDFSISYYVNDADSGDLLSVTEALDGNTTKSFNANQNVNSTISVKVASLSLGAHTVSVNVSDTKGGNASRIWTFQRTNAMPIIDGSDQNLGDKNIGFTYGYTVNDTDNDTLTVTEQLNTEALRTINNAPKGEALSLDITSEKLYSLSLNSLNTIKITVSDGKGGIAYRSLTFRRTNSAPGLSGQDTDLGLKTGGFAENYMVTDIEGDNVVVTERIDDKVIRTYQATLGQQATIELTRENWLTLSNGAHFLRIEAVDGNFATSVRVWNFSKLETVISFQFMAPEETDERATKVLISPTWKTEGSVAKIEACNNAFDAVPTWEDITALVSINRVFNFTNMIKAADKWGVDVRFTITKNAGYEGEVSISGFGGAYE